MHVRRQTATHRWPRCSLTGSLLEFLSQSLEFLEDGLEILEDLVVNAVHDHHNHNVFLIL